MNIKINNIDDFLGARENRYFSNGYKGVNFAYSGMAFSNEVLTCNLNLSWNSSWGSKQGKSLAPHLGTVEYFNIACAAADALICSLFKAADSDREKSWIAGFSIKTQACNKGSYSNIAVKAMLMNTANAQSINGCLSRIRVQVGDMEMFVDVDHPAFERRSQLDLIDLKQFENQIQNSYYTDGYKNSEMDISNLDADFSANAICANIDYSSGGQNGICIGKQYLPFYSISDFILSTGQITQVLLYLIDRLSREQSNNLWLREMSVSYAKPTQDKSMTETVTFTDYKRVRFKGDDWSMVTLNAALGNIQSTIKVAHMLSKADFLN